MTQVHTVGDSVIYVRMTTINRGYFENRGNFGHPLTEHCGVTVTIGGWPKLPILAKVTPVYGNRNVFLLVNQMPVASVSDYFEI